MKKVLVIGAAGSVGLNVIKYLLSEGKYEITALDLKNKKVFNRLRKYRKRINIVYGDVLDRGIIEPLVKDSDYVINLASCLPPMAEYNKDLPNIIECVGTENIVRAINFYNPKCHLIYASTTSLYDKDIASVKDKINEKEYNYFANAKIDAEKFIIKKTKNYTILRLSLVLTDLRQDPFIYSVNFNDKVEVISKEDAAYALVRCIIESDKVNRKILNIGGGKTCQIVYKDLIKKILKYHGISFNYINTRLFTSKNYKSPVLLDSDEANNILKYRNDSIDSYILRQKRRSKKRKFSKLMGKLHLKFMKDNL